jgi:hypothetical protein
LDKEDKRGSNHNPTGQNQYSEVKSGQKEVKNNFEQVKSGQSGQSFLETETGNGNKKQESLKKDNLTVITKKQNFQKPTFEEVDAYCQERNNGVDAQKFFDYYTANGWKVGKNSMKDWRAAVRTWERGTVAAPASRKSADDDAEYWEDLARRLKVQEGAAQ